MIIETSGPGIQTAGHAGYGLGKANTQLRWKDSLLSNVQDAMVLVASGLEILTAKNALHLLGLAVNLLQVNGELLYDRLTLVWLPLSRDNPASKQIRSPAGEVGR